MLILLFCVSLARGDDFPIVTATAEQTEPDVAASGDNYLVVWTDSRGGTSNLNIYGQIITPTGELLGTLVPVCTRPGNQRMPAVASNGLNYLVVWEEATGGISGRYVGLDGATDGDVFEIASGGSPDVAAFGSGYLVVWIEGAVVKAKVLPDGEEVIVSGATGSCRNPAVASMDEYAAIVWEDSLADAKRIMCRLFYEGAPLYDEVTLILGDFNLRSPAVSAGNLEFILAWQDVSAGTGSDVFAQRFSLGGSMLGTAAEVAVVDGSQSKPDIAADTTGYLVVWEDNRAGGVPDIYGARVSGFGTVIGDEIAICTNFYSQFAPSVASTGEEFLVVWVDGRSGADADVYGIILPRTPEVTDSTGPDVVAIYPEFGVITSRWFLTPEILITDPSGVDSSSILFEVNGEEYRISADELSFENDTLFFSPSAPYPEHEIIKGVVTEVSDTLGNFTYSGDSVVFYTDFSPPAFSDMTPEPHAVLDTTIDVISVVITDFGGVVVYDSCYFVINGVMFTLSDSAVFHHDYTFACSTEYLGIIFSDTVNVCVFAQDLIEIGPPNRDSVCWSFSFEFSGPVASPLSPPAGAISSDPYIPSSFLVSSRVGIDTLSIRFRVNGDIFEWGSPSIELSGDTVVFTPCEPYSGDVLVELVDLRDILGNPASDTARVEFFVDTLSPYLSWAFPGPGDMVEVTTTSIRFTLEDNHILDTSSVILSFDGEEFPYDGHILRLSGANFAFYFSLAGITLVGDSLYTVCISAEDLITWGEPNAFDSCYVFYTPFVDTLPPELILTVPAYGDTVDSTLSELFFSIIDDNILDTASVYVSFLGSIYGFDGEILTFSDSLFVFSLPEAGLHLSGGMDYLFCIHAEDVAENELDTCFIFYTYPDTSDVETDEALPVVPFLVIYPNPFNSEVAIKVSGRFSSGRLEILTLSGERVAAFNVGGGSATIIWDAGGFPTGLYLCRFTHDSGLVVRKLLLLK